MSDRSVVFVIDDDPSILKGMQRLLKAHEFDVEAFDSVEDFESRFVPRNAACIVLDVNIAGMSGIDLSHRLNEAGVTLPVIFITADDSPATRAAAMAAGGVEYLTKPVLAADLLAAITKASAVARGAPTRGNAAAVPLFTKR